MSYKTLIKFNLFKFELCLILIFTHVLRKKNSNFELGVICQAIYKCVDTCLDILFKFSIYNFITKLVNGAAIRWMIRQADQVIV